MINFVSFCLYGGRQLGSESSGDQEGEVREMPTGVSSLTNIHGQWLHGPLLKLSGERIWRSLELRSGSGWRSKGKQRGTSRALEVLS